MHRKIILPLLLMLIISHTFPAKADHKASKAGKKSASSVQLKWMESNLHANTTGVTWGVPWKEGVLAGMTDFALRSGTSGNTIPVQSWPLAYWPDGSIKWTAHATLPVVSKTDSFTLIFERNKITEKQLGKETASDIEINTKLLRCVINKHGNILISSISRQGKKIAENGRLIVIDQNESDTDDQSTIIKSVYESRLDKVTLEQNGSVRAVVKLEGSHYDEKQRSLLPFIVRLYFYQDSEAIKVIHTIIYNGKEQSDFIKGIGLRLDVPLQDDLYNRHIRFVGENDGVFAESVKTLTGLRREAGKETSIAQVSGKFVSADSLPGNVAKGLKYVPAFGDYTLTQVANNAFTIRKRTAPGYSWLNSTSGNRSAGTAYLGTPQGGLAAGIRNFWQSFPAQIDIRHANSDKGEMTLWLWAPDASAMDMRFYHDGMNQNSYKEQNEGLDITYEDYEPGFSTPYGVARTSEISLRALAATPSNEQLAEIAKDIQHPSLLVCTPEYIKDQKVFGNNWSLPDYSTPVKKQIEDQLDWNFSYYKTQIDERNWYGFWNYGDVMHAYDPYRHVWRYDVGGFAWDNSELSTDLWLWYYFLRTGRSDVFRIAEAMTRHTGEVDVYHIGDFAPLGSRHNVVHWGCSAKQLRISTAANRRFLYYLTADERIGDLLHDQVDGLKKLHDIVPTRKRIDEDPRTRPSNIVLSSFGTDWGAIAAAWLTEWERTLNPTIKEKLINSMTTIARQPRKFFTANGYMDVNTGKFEISKSYKVTVSHLNAVFGLTEICEELTQLLKVPEFNSAWLQYCRFYNASPEEQQKELGAPLTLNNMKQSHSRLTAFAAWYLKDPTLAKRAWDEFYTDWNKREGNKSKELKLINPPLVLRPVHENPIVSTNGVAQWSLAAIQCLSFLNLP